MPTGLSRAEAECFGFSSPLPLSTPQAAVVLQRRGYAATPAKLKKLVITGKVSSSEMQSRREPAWTEDRISEAAEAFEQSRDHTTAASFFFQHGLTMADVYAALFSAHRSAVDRWGSLALNVLSAVPCFSDFQLILSPPKKSRGKGAIHFEPAEGLFPTNKATNTFRKANHGEQGNHPTKQTSSCSKAKAKVC